MEPPRQCVRGCAGPGSVAARRHKEGSEVLPCRGRAGIHDQSAVVGSRSTGEPDCSELGGRAAHAGARLAGATAGSTPVLLEKREMGAWLRAVRRRLAGIL